MYLFFKRIFDIVLALSLLILSSLLLILSLIITKITSKGNVIFTQERYGKNGKLFKIYKIRTMKLGTPQNLQYPLSKEDYKKYTYKWGSIMRRLAIDELPQLVNILKGDMSFIGFRPAPIEEDKLHEARLNSNPSAYVLKPGLSGPAQIKCSSLLTPEEYFNIKVENDSKYVEDISFLYDTKLCFLTVGFLFKRIWRHLKCKK